MPDMKISQETAASALTGAEMVPIVQSGANFRTTTAAIAALFDHSGLQPLDGDLTAIAALTTTAYGRALLELANQAALVALLPLATAAQIQAGTAGEIVAADKLHDAHIPQTLTDGATVAWDMAAGFNAKVTLGGNRTLTVSNPKAGLTYSLGVNQDATGTRLMTWPASFDWGTTGAPTLTTTASKRDRITLYCTDAATPKFDAFLSGKGFS